MLHKSLFSIFSALIFTITTLAQSGHLLIISIPAEMEVEINGKYRGKTPLEIKGMQPGNFSIKISEATGSFKLEENKTLRLKYENGNIFSLGPNRSGTSESVIDSTKKSSDQNTSYYIFADEMPEPIGGIQAIQKKVVYPLWDQTRNISGKVYVLALIDEMGNVAKTEILAGINESLNRAASDAVKNSKFKPGKIKGKPVKVQVSIPIVFKLH